MPENKFQFDGQVYDNTDKLLNLSDFEAGTNVEIAKTENGKIKVAMDNGLFISNGYICVACEEKEEV